MLWQFIVEFGGPTLWSCDLTTATSPEDGPHSKLLRPICPPHSCQYISGVACLARLPSPVKPARNTFLLRKHHIRSSQVPEDRASCSLWTAFYVSLQASLGRVVILSTAFPSMNSVTTMRTVPRSGSNQGSLTLFLKDWMVDLDRGQPLDLVVCKIHQVMTHSPRGTLGRFRGWKRGAKT